MPLTRRPEPVPITGAAAALVFTTILTQGPLSRVDVARRTGMSSAAVTKAVRPLLDAAYLIETPDRPAETAIGRPAAPLRVWADRAFFVGVKVTAEEVIGVVTDLQAKIRGVRHLPLAARDVDSVVAAIGSVVDDLLAREEDRSRVRILGVAVSGDVDRAVGMVRYSPFLGWREVPLAQLVESRTGLPTTVENDVRALTKAEEWFGAGVGARTFALITVGSGIGCGLVVDGSVVSGAHGVAGEIGHLTIDPDGPACHCGNQGCLEAIAADPAIVRQINALPDMHGVPVATPAEAAALAHSGHEGARAVYTKAGHAIGLGLAAVVNLIGPERVIISGEGLAAYDLFEEQIRATFARYAFGTAAQCELTVCPLPFDEWARGAAAVAIQTFIEPDKN
jgi:predicted NBD/HSP70 family sugar kinase